MMEVSLTKLRKYVKKNPSYGIVQDGHNITLAFSPNLPAIEAHLGEDAKIELFGHIVAGKVRFTSMKLTDAKGKRDFDTKEAEASFAAWLDDIESRY